MFKMEVPYDKRIMQISLEDKNLAGVLVGRQSDYVSDKSEKEIVEESLDHVIGSQTLEELAKGKKDIVIISSDHTRPVPSKIITPILLRRIRSVSPDARIRILVATGFHRPSTKEELIDKYGKEIVENEEIVMHIAKDENSMKKIGTLPSGGACIINKIAADADLLIAEGFIEGAKKAGKTLGKNLFKELDRKKAIEFALKNAKKGDIVLILGKGHEKSILRADGPHDFEDIKVTKEILGRIQRSRQ